MRYFILSDIHGNLEALSSILEFRDYDRVILLGDLVGYGANPNEVIDAARALDPVAIVRGNHDKVVAGINDGSHFVAHALEAAIWSRHQLTAENTEYLRTLPLGPVVVDDWITVSHGSPSDEEEYIIADTTALSNFAAFDTPICLFGHSHLAMFIGLDQGNTLNVRIPVGSQTYALDFEKHTKYLVNPGSIGQPRDGDWRCCAAVLDTEKLTLEYLRWEYDLPNAQKKIRQAGLPPVLADRLARGR